MKSAPFLNLFLIVLLAAPPAFADTYVKSQVLAAGESQSWLSALKKRVETKIPVVGKVVIITRVDRGVEWILMPGKKVYQEKPIALPYLKDEGSASPAAGNIQDYLPQPDEEALKNQCVLEIRRLPEPKTIAGYKTTGFIILCGEDKGPGKVWMAPPLGTLAEVEQQDLAYNHAHAMALFANYPLNEKQDLVEISEKFGDLVKTFMVKHMAPGTRFPRGVMMRLESSLKNAPPAVLFEVKEIKTGPADPALFEIPPGYQKVPDLTRAYLETGLQNLDQFSRAVEHVKVFFSKAGITGAGSQPGQMAEIFERLKKYFKV